MAARGTAVVWRTALPPTGDHDVLGAFLGRDGRVESFPVAASAADERDPSILAIGDGTFLVAWRTTGNLQSRIAWRIVGEPAGRRRVVR